MMTEGGKVGERGFSVIVAMDRKRGIGKGGALPWKLSGDMRFFKELTTCPDSEAVEKRWGLASGDASSRDSGTVHHWDEVREMLKFAHPLPTAEILNVVIMGRKTWDSLPESYKPLPGRTNVVLTGNPAGHAMLKSKQVHVHGGLRLALSGVSSSDGDAPRHVIGGAQVYAVALADPACAHLYITEIDAEFPCDTFFPETPDFRPVVASPWIEEHGIRYRFRRYDRV